MQKKEIDKNISDPVDKTAQEDLSKVKPLSKMSSSPISPKEPSPSHVALEQEKEPSASLESPVSALFPRLHTEEIEESFANLDAGKIVITNKGNQPIPKRMKLQSVSSTMEIPTPLPSEKLPPPPTVKKALPNVATAEIKKIPTVEVKSIEEEEPSMSVMLREDSVGTIAELEKKQQIQKLVRKSWTSMRKNLGFFWGWIAKKLFSGVEMDEQKIEGIKKAEEQGTIVYVMRSRSSFNYFIFNELFVRYGLPLSRFSTGVRWMLWHSFWKQLQVILYRLGRILGLGGRSALKLFGSLVRGGETTTFFLKEPQTLSSHLRHAMYWVRDKVRGWVGRLPAEGGESFDPFLELVQIQRSQKKPIFLVPQILIWDRSPTSSRKSFMDVFFGEKEYPGLMREIFLFIRDRRKSQVRGGKPINVQGFLSQHKPLSDEEAALRLREVLEDRLEREYRVATGPVLREFEEIKELLLESPRIQASMHKLALEGEETPEQLYQRGNKILDGMMADFKMNSTRWLDWVLRLFWRRIYQGIDIDEVGLEKMREASLRAPIVLVPCHKSYVDFLVLSQVMFHYDMSLPHIASGDNLNMPILGRLLRECGAFFIRRSFRDDELYKDLFQEYLFYLLKNKYTVEFFIEGTRSRTGKLKQPKMGMLSIVVDSVLEKHVDDLYLIPISIAYDKIIEGESYTKELLGGEKKKERLIDILQARSLLKLNFGRIQVEFGDPLSVKQFLEKTTEEELGLQEQYDPLCSKEDRKHFNRSLAYRIIYEINQASLIPPTAIISSILLTHARKGMSLDELKAQFLWLRKELLFRKAKVSKVEDVDSLIENSIEFLGKMVKKPKETMYPILRVRDSRRLEMSYYRNQLLHFFVSEGIIACAIWSFSKHSSENLELPREELLRRVRTLSQLLKLEVSYKPSPDLLDNFDSTLEKMAWRGMLRLNEHSVFCKTTKHPMLSFLRSLFWPFVDGYWVATLSFFSMVPDVQMEEKNLLEWMQNVASSLFHEGYLLFSDSVSKETMKNALEWFEERGILSSERKETGRKSVKLYFLAEKYQKIESVQSLSEEIGLFTSCDSTESPIKRFAEF